MPVSAGGGPARGSPSAGGLAPGHVSVSVVIPALDEEHSIGAVLEAIPRDKVAEVVVVDGGSRDATVAVAAARGARVVVEPRRGYGRACARGVLEACGDVVVFLDADGACDPRDIEPLVTPVARGDADLVLGSRLRPGAATSFDRGAMPFQQLAGNKLGALLIRVIHGLPLTDLGPFRAVRRRSLLALALENLTYGWPTEMIVKAARAGWRIVEVPVSSRARTGGRSKVSGTLRGASLAALHILGIIVGSARSGRRKAAAAPRRGARGRTAAVVVMAKQPVPGLTKTRLCPPLAPGDAAGLYDAMLRDTIGLVSGFRRIDVAIAVTPATALSAMSALAPPGAHMLAVEGADIGQCLSAAMERLFSQGFTRVLALNSDGPTLPAAYILGAVDVLERDDLVLGPAEDGGYYLIGLRQNQPGLFREIRWSTEHAAADTLERAGTLGLTVARLPSWYDVDTPADLERLRAELAAVPEAIAPCTRAFLAHRQSVTQAGRQAGGPDRNGQAASGPCS